MIKLTYAQAEEIRRKYAQGKCTYYDLAKEYDVSFSMIGSIVRREKHLSQETERFKHGHYVNHVNSPTVNSWICLIRRCIDSSWPGYKNYGGRGISFDPRWLEFSNFLSDMGQRPEGYTLDRINSNGDYCKENCRWSCPARQQHNKRHNKLSWEKVGRIKWMRSEGFTQKEIAEEFGVCRQAVSQVLNGKMWKQELPLIKPGDDTPRME